MQTTNNEIRNLAIKTVLKRKPLVMENKNINLQNIFGEYVLTYKKLKKLLPETNYKDLMQAVIENKSLSRATAELIANVAKDWAVSMGATHFTHWFQPQTDLSAEKHDSFFSFDENKMPIARLSASQLIQSEPDASSFPSGGTRSTFEARGYTAWDPSSPIFLVETPNGKTLCIPSVFMSYHGDALDLKTPLIRSNINVQNSALRLLKLMGDKTTKYANVTLGAEQEYFLIDKSYYYGREDLTFCGRTLVGGWSPKGQEMEDHYFGAIPPRVMAFMQELEFDLFRLGVPCKTRHNEVAPSQFEFAPIFEEANISADHNQLLMETMRKVADKHNFAVLFHEKPFSKMNGSGKHLNWSMETNQGDNLLDPSDFPRENYKFLIFLLSIIKGIAVHGGALRASIATHSNDLRLGANEAPPAIMSVFIGQRLEAVLNNIEKGLDEGKDPEQLKENIELAHLPKIKLDDCDRNRTSPFDFTGNKFEFRSVGSGQSISYPLTMLNAVIAYGMDYVAEKLEQELSVDKDITASVLRTIKKILPEVKNILFSGNGYADDWKLEAEKRKLPILNNTPMAYKWLKDNSQFLVDSKIYTKTELEAKFHVVMERYCKATLIEGSCLIDIVKTFVLPSAEEELYKRNSSMNIRQKNTEALYLTAKSLGDKVDELEELHRKTKNIACSWEQADILSTKLIPLMEDIHTLSNNIEQNTRDYLWKLPKYREMLFLK